MDLEKRLRHLKWIGNDDRLDNKKWEDISSEKTELYEVQLLKHLSRAFAVDLQCLSCRKAL